MADRRSIAVVGAGVSGLTAAYILSKACDVTLYEAEPRLGGHAHTHTLTDSGGAEQRVDSGFIVHNDRTYPLLRRLFAELDVAVKPTEMSMSITDPATGLSYAGGRGLGGVFAQPRNALSPRFLRVLGSVRRFHKTARHFLTNAPDDDQTSLGEFLTQGGFSEDFRRWYAVPLVACVWSSGAQTALEYPARYLFQFLEHHGMLQVKGSPTWYTVVGGSHSYVDALEARLASVKKGSPVRVIERGDGYVTVTTDDDQRHEHDAVVIATHADDALRLLADPSENESRVLGAFRYSPNTTVLHTDDSILPPAKRAKASWNYLVDTEGDRPPVVTYWMNKLQRLESSTEYLVSLGAQDRIDPAKVLAVMDYSHPIYDQESVRAQGQLPSLATATTVYAGAYHGWGFHEDGCRSGVQAAAALGVDW